MRLFSADGRYPRAACQRQPRHQSILSGMRQVLLILLGLQVPPNAAISAYQSRAASPFATHCIFRCGGMCQKDRSAFLFLVSFSCDSQNQIATGHKVFSLVVRIQTIRSIQDPLALPIRALCSSSYCSFARGIGMPPGSEIGSAVCC